MLLLVECGIANRLHLHFHILLVQLIDVAVRVIVVRAGSAAASLSVQTIYSCVRFF